MNNGAVSERVRWRSRLYRRRGDPAVVADCVLLCDSASVLRGTSGIRSLVIQLVLRITVRNPSF